ncbi:MAG: ABC transporter permease [Chloroflexi bacterium HGW-Chloroflexi-10]|nr:MAG: ABC transporter permease [Chloroflexi bacterium HGW-Chloroflexi-10]
MNTTSTIPIQKITFLTQIRAIGVIAAKDWKVYWRYPLNAVSSIFQPLIWLTPIYFLGQAFSVNGEAIGFAGYAGTSDYMSFIILGAALSNFLSAVFWGMGYSLKEDMDIGVLESNWMTPVPRLLMLFGRTLNNLLITTITSCGTLLTAAVVFGFHPTGNVVAALLTLIPVLIGLYGFGFAFAALVMIVREANTMVDMGNFLVDFLSGSQFPVKALPRWLWPVSFSIPLTYGYDAIRGWILKTTTLLPLKWEILLLLISMIVMVVIGIQVFNALERSVRRKGTLGQH